MPHYPCEVRSAREWRPGLTECQEAQAQLSEAGSGQAVSSVYPSNRRTVAIRLILSESRIPLPWRYKRTVSWSSLLKPNNSCVCTKCFLPSLSWGLSAPYQDPQGQVSTKHPSRRWVWKLCRYKDLLDLPMWPCLLASCVHVVSYHYGLFLSV